MDDYESLNHTKWECKYLNFAPANEKAGEE